MKVKEIFKKVLDNRIILSVFVLAVLITTLQSILSGPNKVVGNTVEYCSYNNYIIFKQSFEHLKSSQDLYVYYPREHWDLFKYTPTFAAFFGFFALFPDSIGLFLWNLLNALILYFAVFSIPKLNSKQKLLILIFSFIEFFTSIQNEQSNAIMAGLIIMSFALLEKRNYLIATLLIVISVYIKLFGIIAVLLYIFYPEKLKLSLYSLMWFVILFMVPLIFVDINQYLLLFESYANMLSHDHSVSFAYSVMGWLNTWFGLNVNSYILVIVGAVLLCLPLIQFRKYSDFYFRFLMLTSILIWVVIFNHKAESPTFVIAIAGASVWFVVSEKKVENIILFIIAIIFTSLSPTDLFPEYLRENIAIPYSLKVFPMILIWVKINIDLFSKNKLIPKA